MKKLMLLLGALMIVVVISVYAQDDNQKKTPAPMGGMGMMHEMMQGKMGGMMGGAQGGPLGFLKLTDEQRAKVQDLALAHQKEMISIQADLQKQHAALKLEITAEKFNESKVKTIQGEISKLTGEIAMKTILHQRAVRDLLTAEQKKMFDQHILSGGPMGPGRMMGRMGMPGMMGPEGMGQGMMMDKRPMNGPSRSMSCPCMQ